jgi:hypothetical protein
MPPEILPPPATAIKPLRVVIRREMWSEYFVLELENGHTEEMEPDALRAWFKERGANMDKRERILDHVWNFQHAVAVIDKPREPKTVKLPFMPNI